MAKKIDESSQTGLLVAMTVCGALGSVVFASPIEPQTKAWLGAGLDLGASNAMIGLREATILRARAVLPENRYGLLPTTTEFLAVVSDLATLVTAVGRFTEGLARGAKGGPDPNAFLNLRREYDRFSKHYTSVANKMEGFIQDATTAFKGGEVNFEVLHLPPLL